MFRRSIGPNSTNRRHRRQLQQNERTFTGRPNARRRIFRQRPIRWAFVPAWTGCSSRARPLCCRRSPKSTSVQLFLALCVCLFLYAVRWLLFLDNRASCDRRRMERGRAPSVGKSWRITDGPDAAVCPDSSTPPSFVCVDGYSARSRRVARYQARLSQLAFLFCAGRGVPRIFSFGGARVPQTFCAPG